MDARPTLRVTLGVAVSVALCLLAAWRGEAVGSSAPWYAIVPPVMAVALALLTRRLLPSLGVAVLVGAFLAELPDVPRGLLAGPRHVLSAASDPINVQILAFVALILVTISILIASGGLQGIVDRLARFARGARSTQLATALMGLAVFIDDYANTMIVGSSMRPVCDRHRVSREKLAFLVDATSAPVAGLAVISTWIGYEVGLFREVAGTLGIERTGYSMFFDALGFRFYCILMIIFVLANVISGSEFGAMARAESRARMTGALWAPGARPISPEAAQGLDRARVAARTAVIPMAGLFVVLLAGLWLDGKGGCLADLLRPGAWRAVIGRAENNILILAMASAASLIAAVGCSIAVARLRPRDLLPVVGAGLRGSLLPIAILIMAWSLKSTCDALATGTFLVDAVGEVLSPFIFPALVFLLAGLTSFATGTSWGTMAILIPTAIPIAHQLDGGLYGITTMMSLGAVLDGAILGDHCSPISDTTIMSSIASGCDHLHHVSTQIPYSLTVGAIALVAGYLPGAVGVPSPLSLLAGAGLIVGGFMCLRRRQRAGGAESS